MVLTKYHRDEFPDVREDFEAVHPPKREAPFRAAYTGVAADALFGLHLADGSLDTAPLTLTDWSAQLGEAFGAVESALGWLASNTQHCIEQTAYSEYYAWHGLHEACVVVKSEVGGWRRELAPVVGAKAGA